MRVTAGRRHRRHGHSYRGRSAIREVGKAFGLSEDTIGALSSSIWGMGGGEVREAELRRAGIDLKSARMQKMRARHGDPILSAPSLPARRRLRHHLQPARRGGADRQWRDGRTHLRRMGQGRSRRAQDLKVDVLGLGMLTCIRKAFELVAKHYGEKLASPPSRRRKRRSTACSSADSLGVFQVEPRPDVDAAAPQAERIPRSRDRVAIVRPGPIQGDMVHPYLQRREKFRATGEEPRYPSPSPAYGDKDELKDVLKKTLGVPLFQEQAMKIAIVAAKFTPSEATACAAPWRPSAASAPSARSRPR